MHECAKRGLANDGQDGKETSAVVTIRTDTDPYQKYQRDIEEQAARDYAKHHIKLRGDGRWVLARKYEDTGQWRSEFWTEIIVGADGSLIVHGDISPSIFCQYGKYTDPLQVVHWVAGSGVSGYLEQKARIGFVESGSESLTKSFDESVAIWELKHHLKDRLDELEVKHDGDENGDEEVAAWRRAIRNICSEHWAIVQRDLYDDLQDAECTDIDEFIWSIGMVPSSRLYYAQAACRKLLELLHKEDPSMLKGQIHWRPFYGLEIVEIKEKS